MLDRAAIDALLDRKMSEIEAIQRRSIVDQDMDRILNAVIGALESIKREIIALDKPSP